MTDTIVRWNDDHTIVDGPIDLEWESDASKGRRTIAVHGKITKAGQLEIRTRTYVTVYDMGSVFNCDDDSSIPPNVDPTHCYVVVLTGVGEWLWHLDDILWCTTTGTPFHV